VLVGGRLDLGGIDVFGSLDREFQCVETPFLELGEQLDRLRGEGRGEQEGIDTKTHILKLVNDNLVVVSSEDPVQGS